MAIALILVASKGILGEHALGSILPLFCLAAWIVYTFRKAATGGRLIVGKTIGPLLAGICLVDWAVLSTMHTFSIPAMVAFVGFFILAVVAQQRIPAS